jgi:hypothetical protein
MTTSVLNSDPRSVAALHAAFLELLPTVERYARFAFRYLKHFHDREDAIQETIALTWAWFRRLRERGKDAAAFPSALARFATRQIKTGRRLCGRESTRDVLSPTARLRHGFQVESLEGRGPNGKGSWLEYLADNTRSNVADAAAFRVDFAAWLSRLGGRHQSMIAGLVQQERTLDLARQFRLSPGRVSQLRAEYHGDWQRFHGELPAREGRGVLALSC